MNSFKLNVLILFYGLETAIKRRIGIPRFSIASSTFGSSKSSNRLVSKTSGSNVIFNTDTHSNVSFRKTRGKMKKKDIKKILTIAFWIIVILIFYLYAKSQGWINF